ncbi:MAG: S1 RNA-binding domain-containing protein [Chloroflexota bacterium]|nr:S1 RNA-binding domain-containing protein [Chloroflexota bacterium]
MGFLSDNDDDGTVSNTGDDGFPPDGQDVPQDDGYWEALLSDGEVASLDEPPPWMAEDEQSAGIAASGDGSGEAGDDGYGWGRARSLLASCDCCVLKVTGYNRGGLLVEFGVITGFVPSSHLLDFPIYADSLEREDALTERVGQTLTLQVIELDQPKDRLILSERAAIQGQRCEEVFSRLTAGDVVSGRVSNLRRFGAFVDLGGFEGLVHISEMSWGRVNYPGDVVSPGDEVQVYVLDVNPAERKIQLSLKQLQSDPWQQVAGHYHVGEIIEGDVTNVVSFGAFARLEEGIEGLIHISELAEGTFLHPRNVVQEGQRVRVRVLNVDPVNRRIGLSLRQVRTNHADHAIEDHDHDDTANVLVEVASDGPY